MGNLRYVPAGTFTQGTPSTEVGRHSDEGPQFQHTLSKNLAVMETEVTQQMWADLQVAQASLPTDPTCTSSGAGMINPVQCVTWYQAVLFANLLSQYRGLLLVYFADSGLVTPINSSNYTTGSIYAKWNANGHRLPTEGEWEYFTRAGTTDPFSINEPAYNSSTYASCPAGDLPALESVAWFCANAGGTTQPVGTKSANPWGLRDAHGNVWEWCWDWFNAYLSGPQTDYRGPSTGSRRVLRGGWGYGAFSARSAGRLHNDPGYSGSNNGFRLLRLVN